MSCLSVWGQSLILDHSFPRSELLLRHLPPRAEEGFSGLLRRKASLPAWHQSLDGNSLVFHKQAERSAHTMSNSQRSNK